MAEVKYIIVKDKLNRLRHLKSDWLHHLTIARDNGFTERDIVESGVFLDKEIFIVECTNKTHLYKRKERFVGNQLNMYQEQRLSSWLRGRELESQLYYSKNAVGLREGD